MTTSAAHTAASSQKHADMANSRRQFLTAWLAWVRSAPPGVDLALEFDGTVSALRQIRDSANGT